ncbi:MAG: ArsR/SmtB family transcription factor [Salibacteraceae bacterium]
MGLSKTAAFTAQQNQLAEWAKALAHPARVAILQHLLQMESCVCGSIVNELDLAQATISQHLKVLKQVGLVQGTVEGSAVCYCIHPENWNTARDALNALFNPSPAQNPSKVCC